MANFFIVHRYTHTLHRMKYILELFLIVFHNASMGSRSGKILNNNNFIKNRITGPLFTDRMERDRNYYSILIPFTESPEGLGCFYTKKTSYTPKLLNICSTAF
jgi:hypothetical protein